MCAGLEYISWHRLASAVWWAGVAFVVTPMVIISIMGKQLPMTSQHALGRFLLSAFEKDRRLLTPVWMLFSVEV